jgi:hypothetical protein
MRGEAIEGGLAFRVLSIPFGAPSLKENGSRQSLGYQAFCREAFIHKVGNGRFRLNYLTKPPT